MWIEWDEKKARSNLAKHGVSFKLASKVFEDPDRIDEIDWVIDGEVRWKSIGRVGFVTVIFVIHTEEAVADQTVVRIISARKADGYERQAYDRGFFG